MANSNCKGSTRTIHLASQANTIMKPKTMARQKGFHRDIFISVHINSLDASCLEKSRCTIKDFHLLTLHIYF